MYSLGICFEEATGAQRDTVITHSHTDVNCQKWELNLRLSGFTVLSWPNVTKKKEKNKQDTV